jgi:hypothetical protein
LVETGDRLVLRPSKLKWWAVFSASAVFAFVGLLIFFTSSRLAGVLVVLFFGLGALVSLVELFSGRFYLLLTPEGISIGSFLKPASIAWSEIEAFTPVRIGSTTLVKAVRLGGRDAFLPDTYGMGADRLAALLDNWRARYSRGS